MEHEGEIYLAHRLRRPLEHGRGYAVAVARSRDGDRFGVVAMIGKEEVGAESLERPALTPPALTGWNGRGTAPR